MQLPFLKFRAITQREVGERSSVLVDDGRCDVSPLLVDDGRCDVSPLFVYDGRLVRGRREVSPSASSGCCRSAMIHDERVCVPPSIALEDFSFSSPHFPG